MPGALIGGEADAADRWRGRAPGVGAVRGWTAEMRFGSDP